MKPPISDYIPHTHIGTLKGKSGQAFGIRLRNGGDCWIVAVYGHKYDKTTGQSEDTPFTLDLESIREVK